MYLAVISVTRVGGMTFSLQSLTDCSFIFQTIIHAGLLKKGLCAVQDESTGQLVIISRRRNNCETIISTDS
jgi:hypothetical protein